MLCEFERMLYEAFRVRKADRQKFQTSAWFFVHEQVCAAAFEQ